MQDAGSAVKKSRIGKIVFFFLFQIRLFTWIIKEMMDIKMM